MNAFQAPQAPPVRPQSDKPAAADVQPLPPDAEADAQAATPQAATPEEPAPGQPRLTGEDMSGWAMGGSD